MPVALQFLFAFRLHCGYAFIFVSVFKTENYALSAGFSGTIPVALKRNGKRYFVVGFLGENELQIVIQADNVFIQLRIIALAPAFHTGGRSIGDIHQLRVAQRAVCCVKRYGIADISVFRNRESVRFFALGNFERIRAVGIERRIDFYGRIAGYVGKRKRYARIIGFKNSVIVNFQRAAHFRHRHRCAAFANAVVIERVRRFAGFEAVGTFLPMILVIMLPFVYVRVLRAAFALIIVFRIEEVIDMRALRAVRFAYFPVLRIVIRPLRVLMYVSLVAGAGGKTAHRQRKHHCRRYRSDQFVFSHFLFLPSLNFLSF